MLLQFCWRYVVLICYLVALTPYLLCTLTNDEHLQLLYYIASWKCVEFTIYLLLFYQYTCVLIIFQNISSSLLCVCFYFYFARYFLFVVVVEVVIVVYTIIWVLLAFTLSFWFNFHSVKYTRKRAHSTFI